MTSTHPLHSGGIGLALSFAVLLSVVPAASQETPSPDYESTTRIIIVYHNINPSATPVLVDDAAAMHAAFIASQRVAELAVTKFRLGDLTTFAGLSVKEVPKAISDNVTANCKPSGDAPNASVLEYRYRCKNYVDADTVSQALRIAYYDFLEAPEPMIRDNLDRGRKLFEQLTRACEDLRRNGPSDELLRQERLLHDAKLELTRLQLKDRVGRFHAAEIDDFEVKKVEAE